jgi:hypothetical protein
MSTVSSSPFLRAPAEIRNAIYTYLACDGLPLLLNRHANDLPPNRRILSKPALSVVRTCKQVHDEYAAVIAWLMLEPGIRTIATVHAFDFTPLISLLTTFHPRQIATASKNKSFVADMHLSHITCTEIANLKIWLDFCDRRGVSIGYVLRWTTFSLANLTCLEAVLRGHSESVKVWRGLGGPSVSLFQRCLHVMGGSLFRKRQLLKMT